MDADLTRAETRVSIALFALTVTSGAVDAITFLGLGHAFAALATGNLLLVGFGVARAPGIPIGRPAAALGAFVIGAALCHVVIARLVGGGHRWFVTVLSAETAVLAAAGLCAVTLGAETHSPPYVLSLVIAILACAMGWRTRLMIESRVPEMPTTVVQISLVKALTDVLSFGGHHSAMRALARARRIATVLGIFVGGVAGAGLLRLGIGPAILVVTAFEACVVAVYARSPGLRPLPPRQT
ncbi:YoaK family protein [Streptomyces sp. NPDC086787]|uniref:YoaK family protein n=1 Tax=Streptomyces sp. NPDC086787 TaxID=3365759 RepID=UPI0038183491